MNTTIENGLYTDLRVNEAGLTITLTDAGREEPRYLHEQQRRPEYEVLSVLLLDHIDCGDWNFLHPDDIGALTDAPLLSNEVERDDNYEITNVGRIFWHERYQIESAVEALLTAGWVWFPLAD